MGGDDVTFPELSRAARRLGLDAVELAEAVLSAMDAGHSEREAATMSIVELLQRRGAYHGKLKAAVDSGMIFQMAEDGGNDRRGTRRMGGKRSGSDSIASAPRYLGNVVDDER